MSGTHELLSSVDEVNANHFKLEEDSFTDYEWLQGDTATIEKEKDLEGSIEEQEVIAAELTAEAQNVEQSGRVDELNKALDRVNSELERYTSQADKTDYALAVFSGIMAGAIDAIFVGGTTVTSDDIGLSHRQVNNFIQQYARAKGFDREHLKDAIGDLEKAFTVAQDNVWKGAEISVSAKNHHLADLAHHPTPLGLVSSIIIQFLRVGTFVNRKGEWHFIFVKTSAKDIAEIWGPALITGILNWLVQIAEKSMEQNVGKKIPVALRKVVHFIVSTPMIVELAKCADNWFSHLVSDMGGSKNTAGGGMGIPGMFLSLLYEFAALPILKDSGLPSLINDLYEKQKMDLRHEIPLYNAAGKQVIPIVLNDIFVRISYFVSRLAGEFAHHKTISGIDWNNVIPFRNRTIDRMLTIASITFTVADTTDAAVRAAIESGGNWVIFSGKFVTRLNYVGAGRAAFSIVKEISSEKKETQLIHEKRLLSEAKANVFLSQLQQYKAQLEEKIADYLAEDIEAFMTGFNYINQGFESGESDLVIKGNVVIQKVLGREPQFTSQKEFDHLVESDISFTL